MPVEHVSDGCVARIRQETRMPQRISRLRVEGDEVARTVAAEHQVARSGQQTLRSDTRGVLPCDFAGLDVDRPKLSLYGRPAAFRAGITFRLRVRVRLIEHGVGLRSADIE